jgi:hypothetical protein
MHPNGGGSRCHALPGTIADGAEHLRRLGANGCQSKSTANRYQMQYARVLIPSREDAIYAALFNASNISAQDQRVTAPAPVSVKILHVGLHCDSSCPGSSAKTLQLFMASAAAMTHQVFLEPHIKRCKERYRRGTIIDAQMKAYIDKQLCTSRSDVVACAQRFGPFDVVLAGRSLSHSETTSSLRFWLNDSSATAALTRGGTIIVEGLHFGTLRSLHSTAEDASSHSPLHPFLFGTTPASYMMRLMFCKLLGMFCLAPPGGPRHSMLPFIGHVAEVTLGPESAILRTTADINVNDTLQTPPTPSSSAHACVSVDDVSLALGEASQYFPLTKRRMTSTGTDLSFHAYLSRRARIFVVHADRWHPYIPNSAAKGEDESNDSTQHHHLLPHKCPVDSEWRINSTTHSFFMRRFGVHGFSIVEGCLSQMCDGKCILDSLLSSFDLIWVVVPPDTQDPTTFGLQREIVEILRSWKVATTTTLKVGGVVALDGFQARQRSQFAAATESLKSTSPLMDNVQEPLLQFLLNVAMRLVSVGPLKWWGVRSSSSKSMATASKQTSSAPNEQQLPWILSKTAFDDALVALYYVGDVSIGPGGVLFLRKMGPTSRRTMNLVKQ